MPFPIASDALTHAFQDLGNQWALLAAGTEKQFNAMTVSWGALGFLWQRPTVMVMVRPPRFTYRFIEEQPCFSLSFFDPRYKKALAVMGSKSGRDTDKAALAGLTPAFVDGIPTFQEAYLTVIARKLYRGQMAAEGFLDAKIDAEFYPEKDYHTVYHAELVKVIEGSAAGESTGIPIGSPQSY